MSAGSSGDAREGAEVGHVSSAILQCFDRTASDVFATHARLTVGARDRATTLLIETFQEMIREPQGEAPDRDAMVDRAHRTFLRRSDTVGSAGGLSAVERVVLDLAAVEHRSAEQIGTVIGTDEDAVLRLLHGARRRVATPDPDEERVLRSSEMWLDDSTRRLARATLAQSAQLATGAPAGTLPAHPRRTVAIGSRRGRALAAASVATACIVAFIAWQEGSTSTPTSSPTQRTTHLAPFLPPPTTEATTQATEPEASDSTVLPFIGGVGPGFVFDPLPGGYAVLGARSIDPSVTGLPTGWLELWASSEAARTSGRWLAMLVVPTEPTRLALAPEISSRQIVVGNDRGLLWTQNDGVSRLSLNRSGHGALEFESFGITDEELLDFAGDTTLNAANETVYGNVALAVLRGMTVQLSRATNDDNFAAALFNRTTNAWVAYGSTASNDMIVVLTTTVEPNDLTAAGLLASGQMIQAGMASGNTGTAQPIVVGASNEELLLRGAGTTRFVRFHDGERTVSVIGTSTLNLLTGLAASVRLTSGPEWQGFLEQRPPVQRSTATPASTVPIGANTTANSTVWTVDLSDEAGGTLQVSEQRPATRSTDPPHFESASGAAVFQPSVKHPVSIWNTPDAQLIVVCFEDDPGAITVEITSAAGLITTVPLVRVGEASLWGAALAVVDARGSRVEMTDGDGNVIPLS